MHDENGIYRFDAHKLSENHKKCQDATLKDLRGYKHVVVANCFLFLWTLEPYFDMGYPTEVYDLRSQYQNVHGVDEEKVERFRRNFETLTDQDIRPWRNVILMGEVTNE